MMPVLGTAALGLLVSVLLVYAVLQARLSTRARASECVAVKTEDGHILHLFRHLPEGPPRGVVLCLHGLGASHFNFQYPGPSNLALHLATAGFDVWVTGLRGDHDSLAPGGAGRGYSFDHYVQWDLPAVMAQVRERSGSTELHLLGHSMGGLLAYAHVATHGEEGIASVVTMGSPVGFEERAAVMDHQMGLERVVRVLPWLPVRTLARLAVPWLPLLVNLRTFQRQFHRPNIDLAHARAAMWNSLSNVPRGVALQFADWIKNDAFRSANLGVDYRASLARLTVPLMVVAGSKDLLARPGNALRALSLAQSSLKEQLVLGVAGGCQQDYGHIDLIFGSRAPTEVFPRVASFLLRAQEHREFSRSRTG